MARLKRSSNRHGQIFNPPRIIIHILPEHEQEDAQRIVSTLQDVLSQITHVGEAIDLIYFCDEQTKAVKNPSQPPGAGPELYQWIKEKDRLSGIIDKFTQWKMLGARDIAVSIYNIQEGKQSINKILGKTSTIKRWIDKDILKEANKFFDDNFGGAHGVRQGVAHAGEKHRSKGHEEQYKMGSIMLVSNIMGDSVTTVYKGQECNISLTIDTVKELYYYGDLLISAFRNAELKSTDIWRDSGFQ